MRALTRGRDLAESLMTLTLAWYSPADVAVVDDMEVPGFTPQGTTAGKVQAPARQGDTTSRLVRVGDTDRRH